MANRPTRPAFLALLIACLMSEVGCHLPHRPGLCVPKDLAVCRHIHELDPPQHEPPSPDVAARLRGTLVVQPDPASPPDADCAAASRHILALSGGGMYGAYVVGVLNGWTASGIRPTFDIVTGVSTGALIAPFAFLGPEYDEVAKSYYTSITAQDVYRLRHPLTWFCSDAIASSRPLKHLIEKTIDEHLLQEVAKAHAQGRRLYIGTTNLDTKRLVVWDMGAIASSGRPEALELFRTVMLASASVPGFFPPVYFNVEFAGNHFVEMHVDGGVSNEVFVRASLLNLDLDALRAGARPLAGSNLYVIVAGKLYADPDCVKPRAQNIASTAIFALLSGQTRNDLFRLYCLSLVTGLDFHLTAVPQDAALGGDAFSFEPEEMEHLFAAGFEAGQKGSGWYHRLPGAIAEERSPPRTGLSLTVPCLGNSGQSQ
jgi:predicted acylesterase/phospholipase RssA